MSKEDFASSEVRRMLGALRRKQQFSKWLRKVLQQSCTFHCQLSNAYLASQLAARPLPSFHPLKFLTYLSLNTWMMPRSLILYPPSTALACITHLSIFMSQIRILGSSSTSNSKASSRFVSCNFFLLISLFFLTIFKSFVGSRRTFMFSSYLGDVSMQIRVKVTELGPGGGTLIADLLRV